MHPGGDSGGAGFGDRDAAVCGCPDGDDALVDRQQVGHLERGPLDQVQAHVHVDQVVELERCPELHEHFEHDHVDPVVADRRVRVIDVSKIGDACFLQIRHVSAVVDDPHRVGLGKADANLVRELVVGGFVGRIGRNAHDATIVAGRPPYSWPMTPAIRTLEAAGVAFSIHEYERGESLHDFGREAAEKLGLDPDQVFKTLLVTVDGGQAVAIVPVSCKLGLKAIGKALGGKHVEMCDPGVAERITGYVRGGISPFGQKRQLPTVVDETAVLFDEIYVSGGRRGLDIGVAPGDLVSVLGAVVADIAVT